MSKKILNIDDIRKIARFLIENGYNKDYGLNIVTEVNDYETMKRLNEEIFYKTSAYKEGEKIPETTNIIHVDIGGTKFEFLYKEPIES